jgi:hypothetical protein
MTENYSSGNIKIRKKLSMHMRHNFLREKLALPAVTKTPNLRTKPVLSETQKNQQNTRENSQLTNLLQTTCTVC